MASAALRQAFIQPDRPSASQTLRHVADQLRTTWPKLGAFIDDSEADVLAHMDFPTQHRTKLHSTDVIDTDVIDKRFVKLDGSAERVPQRPPRVRRRRVLRTAAGASLVL